MLPPRHPAHLQNAREELRLDAPLVVVSRDLRTSLFLRSCSMFDIDYECTSPTCNGHTCWVSPGYQMLCHAKLKTLPPCLVPVCANSCRPVWSGLWLTCGVSSQPLHPFCTPTGEFTSTIALTGRTSGSGAFTACAASSNRRMWSWSTGRRGRALVLACSSLAEVSCWRLSA